MNSIRKIINHIKGGTVLSRIRDHNQIETEKKWRSFFSNKTQQYIIKNFDIGCKIKLQKDNLLSKAIYNNSFELHELNYLKSTLMKGDVFMDIGANIGLFSIIAGCIVGRTGKVFSFEPTSQTFKQLVNNISLNGYKNITSLNFAVSDNNEGLYINLNDDNNSALNTVSRKPNQNLTEIVNSISIDGFVKENTYLNNISLVKIDVEGWEVPVLVGMKHSIKKFHPTLMLELNQNNYLKSCYTVVNLLEILVDYNYKLFEFDNNGKLVPFKKREYYSYMNIIAIYDQC